MPVDIVIPPGLPRPLAQPHAFEPVDTCDTVPKDQGELRRLPRYGSAPELLALAWRFTQAEFDTFWDWYEDDLLAGARRFDVFVAAQGGTGGTGIAPGTWRTAQFAEVPQHEALRGGRYSVQARVRCIGAAFDERTAPGFFASGTDGDIGGAYLGAAAIFAEGIDGDIGGAFFRLGPVLASDTEDDDGGAFMGDNAAAYLREDSGYILREDGGHILRE